MPKEKNKYNYYKSPLVSISSFKFNNQFKWLIFLFLLDFERDQILWVSLCICHGDKDRGFVHVLDQSIELLGWVHSQKRCHLHPLLSQGVLADDHSTDEHGLLSFFVQLSVLHLSRVTGVESKIHSHTVISSYREERGGEIRTLQGTVKLYVPLASEARLLLNPWVTMYLMLSSLEPWKRCFTSIFFFGYFAQMVSCRVVCFWYRVGFCTLFRLVTVTVWFMVAWKSCRASWYSGEPWATSNMCTVLGLPSGSTGCGSQVKGKITGGDGTRSA